MLSTPVVSKLPFREGKNPMYMPAQPLRLTEQNMDKDATVLLCLQVLLLLFAPLGIAVGFRRIGSSSYGFFFGGDDDSQDGQAMRLALQKVSQPGNGS